MIKKYIMASCCFLIALFSIVPSTSADTHFVRPGNRGTAAPSTSWATATFTPEVVQAYSGTITVNSEKTSGGNTIGASDTGIGEGLPLGTGTEGDPYQISQLVHLVWMGDTVGSSSGKYYILKNDIDASDTTNWIGGFSPIGNDATNFMGIFNGNGKVISNLIINLPAQNYVGLFGHLGGGGVVKDLGLAGGSVTGLTYVGRLVGYIAEGTVSGCYATGPVTGNFYIGGLVGCNQFNGTVSGCHAEGTVTGNSMVGGLVGNNNYGTVSGCYATGPVNGGNYTGGLVGGNEHNGGGVSNCYATGAVSGNNYVGGLMGLNYSPVSHCYATGTVSGNTYVGGLVGWNQNGLVSGCFAAGAVTGSSVGGLVGYNNGGTVNECYATGAVTGISGDVGGLVGWSSGTASNCYATGAVGGGGSSFGGLVGWNNGGTVSGCYWDTNTTGQATSAGGGTGTNTAAMKQQATFAGWDFTNMWSIAEDVKYPFFGIAAVMPPGNGAAGDPYRISELGHLVWVGENVENSNLRHYKMQNDIDASVTAIWDNGAGFAPIGYSGGNLKGIFDGNGKVVKGLNINLPTQDAVGLIGYMGEGGMVKNLGMEGGMVAGYDFVGGLVGANDLGTVSNCHADASVSGRNRVGGLVGYVSGGTVLACHASGTVTGNDYLGGLVGNNIGWVNGCYAAGTVTGISGSFHGGLVGYNSGTVIDSYALGSVTDSASGIDGFHHGGLVGYNSGLVRHGYATGLVSPCTFSGGLVGRNLGTVDNAYWDTNTSGLVYSQGGTGMNTAAMKQQATFAGWDFTNVWRIAENMTYPFLLWEEISTYAVTYNANGATGGTAPAPQTKTNDVALTLANNTGNLEKTGYTFAGWNTATDGTGTTYAEGASYTNNAAVTLYAKWTVSSPSQLSPVYRFWSDSLSSHFFTTSATEKDQIISTWPDVWTYEGIAFYVHGQAVNGSLPVHRFWSDRIGCHMFTISESEKSTLQTRYAKVFTYEGAAWHAFNYQAPGTLPVYRFWAPKLKKPFFTISEAEKNNVIATMSSTWSYQGIAWYAYTSAQIGAVAAAPQGKDYEQAARPTAASEKTSTGAHGETTGKITFSLSFGSEMVVAALLYDPVTNGFLQVLEPTLSPRELVIPFLPFGQRYWLSVLVRDKAEENWTMEYGGWLGRVADMPGEAVETVDADADMPMSLPVENIELPESASPLTLRLYEQTGNRLLETIQELKGGSIYELTVPAWNQWYRLEIGDETSGTVMNTLWIGHLRTH